MIALPNMRKYRHVFEGDKKKEGREGPPLLERGGKCCVGRRVFQRRALYLGELNLEKAVAVTRTPRAEPISLAETRRRGEFESYARCFMKISLHPIGEGHPF